MNVRGIGVDLVQIPRMREVIMRWDERFLRRVFTDAEIAYCRARRDPVFGIPGGLVVYPPADEAHPGPRFAHLFFSAHYNERRL